MMNSLYKTRLDYLVGLFQEIDIGEVIGIEPFQYRNISLTSKFLVKTPKNRFLVKFCEDGKIPRFLPFLEFLNSLYITYTGFIIKN